MLKVSMSCVESQDIIFLVEYTMLKSYARCNHAHQCNAKCFSPLTSSQLIAAAAWACLYASRSMAAWCVLHPVFYAGLVGCAPYPSMLCAEYWQA